MHTREDDAVRTRLGYISADGVVAASGENFLPVLNPATGKVIAQEVDADQLDEIITRARLVYATVWRDTPPDLRGRMLAAWADLIEQYRTELAEVEVADVGHLRRDALGDLDSCVRSLRYYAGIADKLEGTTYAQLPGRLASGVDEPFGVVAGISPYNGNANSVMLKAAPAIIAGNCIVLKALEIAPLLLNFRLVELALEAGIPLGVINLVTESLDDATVLIRLLAGSAENGSPAAETGAPQ